MASKTSKAELEMVIDMAAFGRDLVRRREAASYPEPPRNSGKRRTPSKRALLKAIGDKGRNW